MKIILTALLIFAVMCIGGYYGLVQYSMNLFNVSGNEAAWIVQGALYEAPFYKKAAAAAMMGLASYFGAHWVWRNS